MEDQTILVTGGAGFVGSNFVRHTVASGAKVVNLDALTYAGDMATLALLDGNPNHVFVHGSINNRPLVTQLLDEHQPQALVNFAAESHVDRSIDEPAAFMETNIIGVFELLEATRAHLATRRAENEFRFLHVSTDEVYGSVSQGRSKETSPLAPNSPYAASKAAAEHLVRSYFQTYGIPVLTTRSSNNYGPFQFPEKLIPLMIANALDGKKLPIYGDGRQIRDWIHVDDNCVAITAVLRQGNIGNVYNIGSGTGVENIEITHRVCATLDRLRPSGKPRVELITHVQDRPGHDSRYALDAGLINSELNWRPAIALDDGLESTIRWYLEHEEWWRGVRKNRYAGERLGLAARATG